MDMNEALFNSLLAIPERIQKLETTIGEQSILIDILLNKSGLDTPGIERAHAYATEAWKETVEVLGSRSVEKWMGTPEGQEAHRAAEDSRRQRGRELWREDCVEAGRILPDPTA